MRKRTQVKRNTGLGITTIRSCPLGDEDMTEKCARLVSFIVGFITAVGLVNALWDFADIGARVVFLALFFAGTILFAFMELD